jgi:hypothetical protein
MPFHLRPARREQPPGVLETHGFPRTVLLKKGAQLVGVGFREGPLEVDVADLLAGGAVVFTGGLASAFYQAAIGDELLNPGEARGSCRCQGPCAVGRSSEHYDPWPDG